MGVIGVLLVLSAGCLAGTPGAPGPSSLPPTSSPGPPAGPGAGWNGSLFLHGDGSAGLEPAPAWERTIDASRFGGLVWRWRVGQAVHLLHGQLNVTLRTDDTLVTPAGGSVSAQGYQPVCGWLANLTVDGRILRGAYCDHAPGNVMPAGTYVFHFDFTELDADLQPGQAVEVGFGGAYLNPMMRPLGTVLAPSPSMATLQFVTSNLTAPGVSA